MASSINASTTAGVVTTADTSGVLNIQTAGTTALTVDTTTNEGIGTTSPAQTLHVKTSTSATPITLGVLSNATGLPALSFNGAYASTTMAGIYGNGATASSLYYEVPSGQSHFFGIADATKITINSSGNLQTIGTISVGNATPSTSGAGITFPATQSASTDANTLDDYEENTWTPGISFGGGTTGITYTSQVGVYTKIGNRVFFNGQVVLSNKGSSSGALLITGLPFTSNATAGYANPIAIRCNNLAAGVTTQVIGLVTVSATTITLESYAAGSITGMTEASANNNSSFMVSGHYII